MALDAYGLAQQQLKNVVVVKPSESRRDCSQLSTDTKGPSRNVQAFASAAWSAANGKSA